MNIKTLPFSKEKLLEIMKTHSTPFYIYDEKGIIENAKTLKKSFQKIYGFKEYFAVKALPNPFILIILQNEGFGADCSSLAELLLCEKIGITGEEIMFTSNNTSKEEFLKAAELGAIINLDDISHIEYLEKSLGKLPELICFRYNPGPEKTGNVIIGDPKEAKFGLTKEQLIESYRICKEKGVKRFGLHTMIVSNELNPNHFIETVNMLLKLVLEISEKLEINFEFINMGGGIGIPYRPNQQQVDYKKIERGIESLYNKLPKKIRLKLYMECGRVITGPYGFLVTKVQHIKQTYKNYIGVDASMSNLMRPGMYGAYHHITVLGKENSQHNNKYDVTGSLCENNDKFAIDRELSEISPCDILIIHDVGAHGHSMGFQYNGKLRSSELLLRKNGKVIEIRRAETNNDYL